MPTTEGVADVLMGYVRDQVARGWTVTVACPSSGWLAEAARASGADVVRWEAARNPGPSVVREIRAAAPDRQRDPPRRRPPAQREGRDGRPAAAARRRTDDLPAARLVVPGRPRPDEAGDDLAGSGSPSAGPPSWSASAAASAPSPSRSASRPPPPSRRTASTSTGSAPRPGSSAPSARRRLGLADVPTVVCVGRLAEQKGQQDLLDAWAGVRDRVPDAHLVLVGDGPDRAALEARTAGRRDVDLVGVRSDVDTWLAAADVIAAPSHWEGMAVAPLEAMASGRSVVATDVEGMAESMPRGGGLIVEIGDVDALADGIADRLLDPDLADREGAVAEQHVAAHHDVNSSARDVARVTLRQYHRGRGTGDVLMALEPMALTPPRRRRSAVTVLSRAAPATSAPTSYASSTARRVVVVDDLSSAAPAGSVHDLVVLDLADQSAPERLHEVMTTHGVDAVVHLAARKQVGESVQRPAWYYQQNVGGLANLLVRWSAPRSARLVFSSSAAVYGNVADGGRRSARTTRAQPVSPYGETKLVGEWLCRAAGEAWGLRWTALRYFNVAGAATPELGDPPPPT